MITSILVSIPVLVYVGYRVNRRRLFRREQESAVKELIDFFPKTPKWDAAAKSALESYKRYRK